MTAPKAALLAVSSALLLSACEGALTGPLGPNGGTNLVDFFTDGEREPLESLDLRLTRSSSAAVMLTLSGGVDPLPDAVDDEYGYVFRLELDAAQLERRITPITLNVQGDLQYAQFGLGSDVADPAWTNDEASDEAVRFAMLHRTCFCADPNAGTQRIVGTVTLDRVDAGSLQGRVSVTVSGDVPNAYQTATVEVTADFDLARP